MTDNYDDGMVGYLVYLFPILTGKQIPAFLIETRSDRSKNRKIRYPCLKLHSRIIEDMWSRDWHLMVDVIYETFKRSSAEHQKNLVINYKVMAEFIIETDDNYQELNQLHKMVWKL